MHNFPSATDQQLITQMPSMLQLRITKTSLACFPSSPTPLRHSQPVDQAHVAQDLDARITCPPYAVCLQHTTSTTSATTTVTEAATRRGDSWLLLLLLRRSMIHTTPSRR